MVLGRVGYLRCGHIEPGLSLLRNAGNLEHVTTTTLQCDTCGFRADAWTGQDASKTAAAAAGFLEYAVEGLPVEFANRRPTLGRSILESASEVARVLARVAGEPEPFGSDGESFGAVLDQTRRLAAAAFRELGAQPEPERLPDASEAAHAVMHALREIAATRVGLDDTVGPMTGHVQQISASGGGVPKVAVDEGEITVSGLVGDRQAARAHHGRPWQAICLYSAEVIDQLRAEGHSISPGAAGENLTLRGIDWDQIRAGVFVDIREVRLQVSVPAVPCSKNARWFADGDPDRILHEAHPGASRWYASVISGGTVKTGDPVTVRS